MILFWYFLNSNVKKRLYIHTPVSHKSSVKLSKHISQNRKLCRLYCKYRRGREAVTGWSFQDILQWIHHILKYCSTTKIYTQYTAVEKCQKCIFLEKTPKEFVTSKHKTKTWYWRRTVYTIVALGDWIAFYSKQKLVVYSFAGLVS